MELGIRHNNDEGIHHARVNRRALENDGNPMGTPSNNTLLDHQQYEVEFIDGRIEILTANILAKNLLAQVDDVGHWHLLIDEIEDHRIDDSAIPKSQGAYSTPSGMINKKRQTYGNFACNAGRFWGLDHKRGFEGFIYSPVI